MNINTILSKGKKILDIFTDSEFSNVESVLADKAKFKFLKEVEKTNRQDIKSKSDVILGEVNGESSLQRNWRPILMISFGFLIILAYGLIPIVNGILQIAHITTLVAINGHEFEKLIQIKSINIPTEMWDLLTYGISGYIIGRTVEKSVNTYTHKGK